MTCGCRANDRNVRQRSLGSLDRRRAFALPRISDACTAPFAAETTTVFEPINTRHSKRSKVFWATSTPGSVSVGDIKGILSGERIAHSMAESFGAFSE